MRTPLLSLTAVVGTVAFLTACGGERAATTDAAMHDLNMHDHSMHSASPAGAPTGPQTPDPNGKIIEVQMVTDETGSYFSPKDFEASRGDVVRFTLQEGVHNVHFLPDSNAGKRDLPAPSDMLQLPGQTYDLKVTLGSGRYYFQCDPHAALGMTGHMTVAE